MKKLAIWVEPNFIHKHVGVRNVIFTVYQSLMKQGCHVDFISCDRINSLATDSWYKIWIDKQCILNNFSNDNLMVSGKPSKIFSKYKKLVRKKKTPLTSEKNNVIIQRIGCSLKKSSYDTIIISAPWVIENYPIPACSHVFGLVYDMIPNTFVIEKINKPLLFAHEHLRGYQSYVKHCSAIFSISKATQKSFEFFFPNTKNRSFSIPPAAPYYLRLNQYTNKKKRENNIILAGPWDLRKGLERIPRILNPIASSIDTLFIYGKLRCSHHEATTFLEKLSNIKKIVWYETINNENLLSLYQRSKVLLFPSEDEGLGLPLIEAQLQGCRVACTRFESAEELLVNGYYFIDYDNQIAAKEIQKMLNYDFDYDFLRQQSKIFFEENLLNDFLKKNMLDKT